MDSNVLRVIQKGVCWNQGELAQYSYLSSVLHKHMKDLYRDNSQDLVGLENAFNALNAYMNRTLQQLCEKNFVFLHEYFDGRAHAKPRISIKVSYQSDIIDLFRDRPVSYGSRNPIKTNTGFSYVYEVGGYYLENNIPEKLLKGEYINPRIDMDRVKKTNRISLMNSSVWKSLWKNDGECLVDDYSCYRSTMIIPMTLKNHDLSDVYKMLSNILDVERAIFGFLCFDHVDVGYFKEDDISFGYIYADLLSLYLIFRNNYTVHSDTYKKVSGQLGFSN